MSLKKLSEFESQEHITAVLRASVTRGVPLTKLSITGDSKLAAHIASAYALALNCQSPNRGDPCQECTPCKAAETVMYWGIFNKYTLREVYRNTYQDYPNEILWSNAHVEGFTHFQIKQGAGDYINPETLALIIYAWQGTKEDVFRHSLTLARTLTFEEFRTQTMDVLLNVLYLRNNVDVKEVEKKDALLALGARLPLFHVTAAIRLLWEAEHQSGVSDSTRIKIVSALLSEIFSPTSEDVDVLESVSKTTNQPISVIEEHNTQPLGLDEMLAIAYE